MRPHRRQPTRLRCPGDSPGKNTGVGCHFLLQCMKVKSESEVAQSCPTLSDPMDCSLTGSSVHGIFQARVLEWGAIAFSSLAVRASITQLYRHSKLILSYSHISQISFNCKGQKPNIAGTQEQLIDSCNWRVQGGTAGLLQAQLALRVRLDSVLRISFLPSWLVILPRWLNS